MISEVGVYKAAAGMEAPNGIPEGLQVVDDRAFTADGWSKESGDQFIEGTGMWCRPNAEATVKFTGTKVWLVGTIDPSHGKRTYISTATRWRLLIRSQIRESFSKESLSLIR